ncbi:MAG TPA: T9SS type A sorting domain-containing protein [Parafilimonas sp.]|nr:T9SS type A sorting domain-containing protein [Parafilimonas sp.]
MKKIYTTLFCLFLLKNFLTAQHYIRVWTSLNQDSTTGFFAFNDMSVDKNGNTYIAGYQTDPGDEYYEKHFYISKINANGDLEWKKNFNKKKDSIDEAIAIAVDADGYVYVTGARIDTFCNICTYNTRISDIITMKYNSKGKRIWLNRYHDSIYILASPSDIGLHPDGTILITGNETWYNPVTGRDENGLLLQKIDNNGATKWVKKMKDVVTSSGCFDGKGEIIVAGASDIDHIYQTRKPMVLKFNRNGKLLWSNVYNEYNKNGNFSFVGCDSIDNIYVNGQTDTLAFYNNPKIITVKYSPAGAMQWFRKEIDHTTSMLRYQGDFKVDAAGNSYVTGFLSKTSVDDDWITSKYDNAGKKKWTVTFNDSLNGSDRPNGLVIDRSGNVFVTGHVFNKGGYAIGVVGYDKKGQVIGSDIYGRKKANAFPVGIGVDKNNNVYVGGALGFYNSPYPASVVLKYGKKEFTAIAKAPSIQELKLFPNPVGSSLNLIFSTTAAGGNYKLVISDMNGNTVLSRQLGKSEKQLNASINVQELKHGVYTAAITDGINSVSKTFIKE